MATPTIGASTTAIQLAGTSITISVPSHAEGDLLVVAIRSQQNNSTSDLSSSGWTRVGPTFVPNSNAARIIGFWTRVATSSEPSSYTFSGQTGTTRIVATMFVLPKVNGVTPEYDAGTSSYTGTATGNTSRTSMTTSHADALVLALHANEVVSPNSSTPTALPGGFTQLVLHPSATGTAVSRTVLWVGHKVQEAPAVSPVAGSSVAGTYTSVTGPTISLPSYTPLAGDVVIVLIGVSNTAAAGTGVAGWSDCGSGLRNATDSSMAAQMVYHVVTEAEQAANTNSWTLTGLFAGSETGVTRTTAFRGGDPTTIIDASGMTFDEAASSTTQYLAGLSGADLADNSLIVSGIVADFATRSFTTPSGFTESIGGAGGWLGTRDAISAAGVDVPSTAIVMDTADETISFTVAITPMPVGATGNIDVTWASVSGQAAQSVSFWVDEPGPHPYPTYKGHHVTNLTGATVTSVTVDPSSVTGGSAIGTGDFMLWTVVGASGAIGSDPAGWTRLRGSAFGTRAGVAWYRFRQSGDTTYTATVPTSNGLQSTLTWFSGVDSALTDMVVGTLYTRSSSIATTTCPAITTTAGNSLVVSIGLEATTATESDISSVTRGSKILFAPQTTSPQIHTTYLNGFVKSSAGVVGNNTITYPNAAGNGFGFQVALPPATATASDPVAAWSSMRTDSTVEFFDTSSDVDGTITSWSWDFDDGSAVSNEQNPTHTFASPGTYDVTLVVEDDDSSTDSLMHTVTIPSTVEMVPSGAAVYDHMARYTDTTIPIEALSGQTWSQWSGPGYVTDGLYDSVEGTGASYMYCVVDGEVTEMTGVVRFDTMSGTRTGNGGSLVLSIWDDISSVATRKTRCHVAVGPTGMTITTATSPGGSLNTVGSKGKTLTKDVDHEIRVVLAGTTCEIWINGVQELSVTDATLADNSSQRQFVWEPYYNNDGTDSRARIREVSAAVAITVPDSSFQITNSIGGADPLNATVWNGTVEKAVTQVLAIPPVRQSFTITEMDTMIANNETVYWAHRGGSNDWPEMTMRAYTNAIWWGVQAIEISVRASSDGVFIMSHDGTTERVTATNYTISSTSSSTLLGIPVDTPVSGGVIGRLEDVLDTYAGFVLLVDNKPSSYITPLINLLKTVPDWEDHIIAKFDGQYGQSWGSAAKAAGFKTCAYLYANNYAAHINTIDSYTDYHGMEYGASQAVYDAVLAKGKPVWGHVCQTTTHANSALSKGASIVQCAGVKAIVPQLNNVA